MPKLSSAAERATKAGRPVLTPADGGAVHLRPPPGLPEHAHELFVFYAEQMALAGTSRLADAPALAELCQCLSDLADLRTELARLGGTSYQTEGGLWKAYPQSAHAADCSRRVVGLMVQLGLTPSSARKAAAR